MAAMSAMAFEGVTVELTDHFRFRLIVSKKSPYETLRNLFEM